jgi:hypothetical protein
MANEEGDFTTRGGILEVLMRRIIIVSVYDLYFTMSKRQEFFQIAFSTLY